MPTPQPKENTNEPVMTYEGDLFNRKDFAESLGKKIRRLKQGVIVVDAAWGDGKTRFAKYWEGDLKQRHEQIHDNHQSTLQPVYIDAFANDFLEDPFLLIAAKIAEIVKENKTIAGRVISATAKLGASLLPMTTKVLLNFSGRALLGTSDFSKEIAEATTGKIEQFLQQEIAQHQQEQDTVKDYTDLLKEYAKKNPLVVMIDELDRCKPSFAVNLMERIKHFFDVENVVFVLFLNKKQLEAAISGTYGANVDAASYLQKFVDLTLLLPKRISMKTDGFIGTYIKDRLEKRMNGADRRDKHETIQRHLSLWGKLFNLSYRDIDRIITVLTLMDDLEFCPIKVYIAVLKVKTPGAYRDLAEDRLGIDNEMIERLKGFKRTTGIKGFHLEIVEAFEQLHVMHRDSQDGSSSQKILEAGRVRSIISKDVLDCYDIPLRNIISATIQAMDDIEA